MITAIAYDIVNNRRRFKLAKLLAQYGERVQKSVFELDLDDKELQGLIRRIEKIVKSDEDSVRIYRLTAEAHRLSIWIGQKIEVHDKDFYLY